MSSDPAKAIAIVTPVFNDWTALQMLVRQIGSLPDLAPYRLRLIAVDDASSQPVDLPALQAAKGHIADIEIIRLACNLGHQRAIAVGLVALSERTDIDAVVVMDSDGEDAPSDLPRLIAAWTANPAQIVVAKRGVRSESATFKAGYALYKLLFRMVTGQTIDFGNFCVLPRHAVAALTHTPSLWNHLAATVTRSRIPYTGLSIDRGTRLDGNSKMNFVGLILHGVGAISVYAEVVLVRIVALALLLGLMVLAGALAVLVVRLGTGWAVPGWASYIAASLVIVFFQAVLLGGLASFQLLSLRSLKPFIPALDAKDFILNTSRLS